MRKKAGAFAAAICVLLGLLGQTALAADIGLLGYLVTDVTELGLLLDDTEQSTSYRISLYASDVGMPDVVKDMRLGGGKAPLGDTELLLVFIKNTGRSQIYTAEGCTLPLTARDRKRVSAAFAADGLTDTERLYAGVGAAVNAVYRHGSYDTTPRLDALLEKPAPDDGWAVPAACAAGGAVVGSAVTAAAFAARGRARRRAAEESAPPKKPE